ncbi:contactin-associated protein-like 5 isoform X1 [Brienomyrus brachyistius]|uniref:contactin-associated protein-like 5 isoform X1 n=1 Tax=Brienomyrus brachyistius TaxID=42636 RepID=UPI0020B3E073|nr:contactin-associated protein-like 5 isoform X1 [Brienomyrus brachyistius]
MDFAYKTTTGMFALLFMLLCCYRGILCKENCDSPLVVALPQTSFYSSSHFSSTHSPGFAKLNRRDGAGGWSPLESNRYQWLEIDLGERTEITAVATQGRYGSSDWVTSYSLMFSDTGRNWKQYRQEDSIWVFPGNTNADSVVHYKLLQPVLARFLRVVPLDWNPNGRIGLRLELYGCTYKSDVASFDGSSSLLYRFSQNSSELTKYVISMKFKTLQKSGVIIHGEGHHEHKLTLELFKGQLFLHIRIGTSRLISSNKNSHVVKLGSLLDDQHWHYVLIERINRHFNFTVDKSTQQFEINGDFIRFKISELSFGGALSHEKSGTLSKRNFLGCLENLFCNEINLIDQAKKKQQITSMGDVTFACSEPANVPVTFVDTESYLQLPGAAQRDSMSVSLQFRTWNKAGLLLTTELYREAGRLWIYLYEGKVNLQISKSGRIQVDITTGSALNDGMWHSVDFNARRGRLTLMVDKEAGSAAHANAFFHADAGTYYFFGGCPNKENSPECKNPFHVFQGCMRLIYIDGNAVDLIKVQQSLIGNYSDLQMDLCGIIDRCSPSHCEHGGRCTQSWNTFYCNCTGTGYMGATCHSSIYEQSCEVYKHKGNTSGFYFIDVDGSGPLSPQIVYCNMTDKMWMVVQHNNTELTKLKYSGGTNQHLAYFNYSANMDQLRAIINQAEYCEQELSYHCKKSRLLNTPDGAPFMWWVGRTDEVQTYWGGAGPGSQKCSCGLLGNCINSSLYCNCDADRNEWTSDTGILSFKEHLPVTTVSFGDINKPGSEAAYKVGHLQCYGDKNFWNAAFFIKETSYLHFPTFHGELSADISFLFKTRASSGVFLENLGIKDFIRIELDSPSEVVFSYDVGNGPFDVRVKTQTPLNDNRWHYVKAERNVKEASLQVDQLPTRTQKAPVNGHIHLQLNSQLFVGGTASRQKGFLGCIRSLQLNGVRLDLEERAKITPGVKAGCPGHCSSYGSLCQNEGRCVERYNGFECDCSFSAFLGPFCTKEVSAYFKPGTSVAYTFKEPYELNRNASSQSSSIYSDLTLRGESIAFSFRTTQAPTLLLYVSSYYREYLAVMLNRIGYLDIKYKLQNTKDAEVFRISTRNIANGLIHKVLIKRQADALSVQIDQNTREEFNVTSDNEFNAIKSIVIGKIYDNSDLDPDISRLNFLGFTGCLSGVQFNSLAPLKAALLHPNSSPVTVKGYLYESQCGASLTNPFAVETTHSLSDHSGTIDTTEPIVNAIRSDSALIGGVIAVVIFIILCALAIMAKFLYRRKETFQGRETKGPELDDSPDFPFTNDPNSQNILSENQKEYLM